MDGDNYSDLGDNSNDDNGFENPIEERWVLAFIKLGDSKKIYYRQFFAPGFYEAYDRVMAFVEKTNYRIIWYKEKRKCGMHFTNTKIPYLEFVCTFCNKKFNNIEPIKCNFENKDQCISKFCSLFCRQEHFYYMHIKRKR